MNTCSILLARKSAGERAALPIDSRRSIRRSIRVSREPIVLTGPQSAATKEQVERCRARSRFNPEPVPRHIRRLNSALTERELFNSLCRGAKLEIEHRETHLVSRRNSRVTTTATEKFRDLLSPPISVRFNPTFFFFFFFFFTNATFCHSRVWKQC